MKTEVWQFVPGYENLYSVSNYGRVKSHAKTKGKQKLALKESIMKPQKTPKGYLKVMFSKNNEKKYFYIHRLVALVHIPNPNNYPEVNHDDKNKANNKVKNLSWVTGAMNLEHRDWGFIPLRIASF